MATVNRWTLRTGRRESSNEDDSENTQIRRLPWSKVAQSSPISEGTLQKYVIPPSSVKAAPVRSNPSQKVTKEQKHGRCRGGGELGVCDMHEISLKYWGLRIKVGSSRVVIGQMRAEPRAGATPGREGGMGR